ncbi:hypothetical protein [Actinoplanes sp. N902-109]|uniref:hypothetical protein n=1 Tax=Actinoplanes sp. (strain N902-109) TaxID=649831 RepID=UPI000329442C|nr:hypothetical protein [Actinoplanes sp. N902-109]AGL17037.1 hypothetical protein L083_3527 [Actinoplanes sp. N902-109]
MEPALSTVIGWLSRGLIGAVVSAAVLLALHPWWVRRRHAMMPLDGDAELRAELAGLAGGGRQPVWLLAPYAYTETGRMFGLPWRRCMRIDVGLAILFRADRVRFRSAVSRELVRPRHSKALIGMGAGAVVMAVAATASTAAGPAHRPSAVDRCLVGFWVEAPSVQPMLLPGSVVARVERRGAIWSFSPDGTATVHPGRSTIDSTVYEGTGAIHWTVDTTPGQLTLTAPTGTAALVAADGTSRPLDAGDSALPGPYTCREDTMTAPGELSVAVLHRITITVGHSKPGGAGS